MEDRAKDAAQGSRNCWRQACLLFGACRKSVGRRKRRQSRTAVQVSVLRSIAAMFGRSEDARSRMRRGVIAPHPNCKTSGSTEEWLPVFIS